MNSNIKRTEIVLVNLSEAEGSVQTGIRVCVVIQNDMGNKHSPTTIVVPFTSKRTKAKLPTHVEIYRNNINNLEVDSTLLCEQILTIDKSQIIKNVGRIDFKDVYKIDKALKISLNIF